MRIPSWHVFVSNTCNSPYFVICFIQCHIIIQTLTMKIKLSFGGESSWKVSMLFKMFLLNEILFAASIVNLLLPVSFFAFDFWNTTCPTLWNSMDSIAVINIFWDFVSYASFSFQNSIIRDCKSLLMKTESRPWQIAYVQTWHTGNHKFYKLPYSIIF